MNIDDYIDNLIDREKQLLPTPFLATKIRTRVESAATQKVSTWQVLAVAASLAFVILVGVGIGDMYTSQNDIYANLNINDSQMENFTLFNSQENE
jgi:hypothetical protein